MVINLPSEREYKSLADNCLIQAFDIVFETDKAITAHPKQLNEEIVWDYLQDKLNASVVLVHQAIEAYMKASVCLTTPFLLLEGKRVEWPVLPGAIDKKFDEFYTIGSEALIYTFFATAQKTYDNELAKHIEEIRKLRNQIVHGISKNRLSTSDLISKILDTYTFFEGKDYWWGTLRTYHLDHPLREGIDYSELETIIFIERLTYTRKKIGKSAFAKHFSVNTKARSYFCPYCLPEDQEFLRNYDYKWAFLYPEQADARLIKCINCDNDNEVLRMPCPVEGCQGTVIWEKHLCLTCGTDISSVLENKNQNITNVIDLLRKTVMNKR